MTTAREISLVTGATGFVGSAVARALIADGHTVRVLARPASDRRNVADLPVEVFCGDLTDRASLDRALADCTALFHVAADYRLWTRDPAAMHRTNVVGTRWIMEAAQAAGVARIVYTSSVATLGHDALGQAADETTPASLADMIGPYKKSKFLAEREVLRMIAEAALPAVIVNPSTPLGPRDIKPTPTGRLIVEAAKGHMPGFVDTGLNIVHVEDVAAGHLAAFARGRVGERYVLGGQNMTLAELLGAIAAHMGRRAPRFKLPHGAVLPVALLAELAARVGGGEPFVTRDGVRMARKRMFFSSAKAERELGYRARPASEALADAIAWFRQGGYLG